MDADERTADKPMGEIGLIGSVSILTGFILGAGIFVLPGPLAGRAGPSVIPAVVIAAVPAVFVGLFNAQLGSAIPISGGGYVYVSRLLSPRAGFLVAWLLPFGAAAGIALAATGFADYAEAFVDVPATPLNIALVVCFLTTNVLGIGVTKWLQTTMVFAFVVSMAVFIVPGLASVDPTNHTPLFPRGLGPFVLVSVALYFLYIGVTIITEIGGELRSPRRTIPLTIAASLGIVALMYIPTLYVLTGVLDWSTLGVTDAAVTTAAGTFLPPTMVGVIAVAAMLAIATSVNATLTVFSRTVLRAGRDRTLPKYFDCLDSRLGTPVRALVLIALPSLPVIALDPEPTVLSIIAVLSILFFNILTGVALYRLPRVYPERYRSAPFQLGRWLPTVAVIGTFVSAGFFILGATESPVAAAVTLGWLGIGIGVYHRRRQQLSARGVDLARRLSTMPQGNSGDREGDSI